MMHNMQQTALNECDILEINHIQFQWMLIFYLHMVDNIEYYVYS